MEHPGEDDEVGVAGWAVDGLGEEVQVGLDAAARTLAQEAPGEGPRPGERAPEAILDGGDSVFLARRRGEWTVLAFATEPPPLPLPDLVGVRVDDEAAATTYAAEPGDLVLLRPDGHIAMRDRDPAALSAWADRWGLATLAVRA